MKTYVILLLCLLGLVQVSAAFTATDSCNATSTSCNLVGTHAATDMVVVLAWRTASATAPQLASGFTLVATGSSVVGAARSFKVGCIIAGTTGSVSSGTWANSSSLTAFTVSGTGATSTADCAANGFGTTGTVNNVSSGTATYSALTMFASPVATSIALLLMGSSTSGNECTPAGATLINGAVNTRASLANATGNWSTATCSITSSVTSEVVIELMAAQVASPTFSPNGGTFGTSTSETLSDATGSAVICYTTDGSTPAATTAGTCSAGSTYASPFSVATDATTLKALGTKTALGNSAVATSNLFTINRFRPSLALLGVSGN